MAGLLCCIAASVPQLAAGCWFGGCPELYYKLIYLYIIEALFQFCYLITLWKNGCIPRTLSDLDSESDCNWFNVGRRRPRRLFGCISLALSSSDGTSAMVSSDLDSDSYPSTSTSSSSFDLMESYVIILYIQYMYIYIYNIYIMILYIQEDKVANRVRLV